MTKIILKILKILKFLFNLLLDSIFYI